MWVQHLWCPKWPLGKAIWQVVCSAIEFVLFPVDMWKSSQSAVKGRRWCFGLEINKRQNKPKDHCTREGMSAAVGRNFLSMFYFLAPQVVDRQERTFNTNCCTVFTGYRSRSEQRPRIRLRWPPCCCEWHSRAPCWKSSQWSVEQQTKTSYYHHVRMCIPDFSLLLLTMTPAIPMPT